MKSRIIHAAGRFRACRRKTAGLFAAAVATLVLGGCIAADSGEPYPRLSRFPPVPSIPSAAEWQALRQQLDAEHQQGVAIAAAARPLPSAAGGGDAEDLSTDEK